MTVIQRLKRIDQFNRLLKRASDQTLAALVDACIQGLPFDYYTPGVPR
jgi:hypothetical protein